MKMAAGGPHRRAGAVEGDGHTGTYGFPSPAHGHTVAGTPGAGAVPGPGSAGGPYGKDTAPPVGVLLDLRAESSEASLNLAAHAAVSALAEITGSCLDGTVSLPRRGGTSSLVLGTSGQAIDLARCDEDCGSGPVTHALTGELAVLGNSYTAHPQWPTYWSVLGQTGYRAVLSAPLPLQGRVAALTLFSEQRFHPGRHHGLHGVQQEGCEQLPSGRGTQNC